MKTKKKIKPKSKRRRNIVKKRLKKYARSSLKIFQKTNNKSATKNLKWWGFTTLDDDKVGIEADENGRRVYPDNGSFHDCITLLRKFNLVGMITLKFHHRDYSDNCELSSSSDLRFEFANLLMENLCNRWFGIKQRQLVWMACEEFGWSNQPHLHIVFSFDKLSEKALKRVAKIDFSNDLGEFYQMALDSCEFLRTEINKTRYDKIKKSQLDLNWKAQWDNDGLCRYMTKLENGRLYKRIEVHNFEPIESELVLTK